MELELEGVVARSAPVGYKSSATKIGITILIGRKKCYLCRLKKPLPVGANVGCAQALLFPQGLFDRHIPLQRIRRPKVRIKRIEKAENATVRRCDWDGI